VLALTDKKELTNKWWAVWCCQIDCWEQNQKHRCNTEGL